MPTPQTSPKSPLAHALSGRTRTVGIIGLIIFGIFVFLNVSLKQGGHMAGPTYIQPGNVGLVIDNYQGTIEKSLMPAGTHWQGIWETVIEVPTAQRTLSLTNTDPTGAVQVNTASNMLQVDVSAQYRLIRIKQTTCTAPTRINLPISGNSRR